MKNNIYLVLEFIMVSVATSPVVRYMKSNIKIKGCWGLQEKFSFYFHQELVWINIFAIAALHLFSLYAAVMLIFVELFKWQTFLFGE